MSVTAHVDAIAQRLADVDGETGPDSAEIDLRFRERLRVLACCLGLVVLATSTRPGRILADTKIDMAVNPLGFLGRALHLWDVDHFGQLQNQAAGYLFPMGPFFALGHLVGMPEWITQRLWMSALMCMAFLGTRRLAARLGIGGPVTRMIGGLAYALGPHGLSALGQNSWEYLPLAMLPWIVLPLITAMEGGSRLKAAARSGIAVALCGGINATATIAVLAVPVIYLLTRPRRTPRLRTLAWWSVAVGFATMWWLVPLFLLGKYAFSWLTYTEKASTTTQPTSVVNVLRGAERWINYLVSDGASLPVGHSLSVGVPLIVITGGLAALGLAGLLRARLPERSFLLWTLLAGLVIVTAGHVSGLESPLAGPIRDLLDGPLAALRNLYKFDGLIRLPLAFGIMHLLTSVARPRPRLGVFAATLVALAGVVSPALTNGLSGPGDFPQIPSYWTDAADWLNSRAGEQAVLAVPGSRFGEYTWGRPMDDVMQPLLRTRWGTRQLVPQGSPGYARVLDALDQQVSAGRGSAGLSEMLARMGVRYLLVRNDLNRAELQGAWPARVHEALDSSPGIRRVAGFGARPSDSGWPDATGQYDQPYQPLEVYEVANADDVVSMADAGRALRLYGTPEALVTLADNGLLKGRSALLNDDAPQATGDPVVADSERRRERNLGTIRTLIGPTLTAGRNARVGKVVGRDPVETGWDKYETVAEYAGIKNITASSSSADPTSIEAFNDQSSLPAAAMDGDPGTQWETGGWSGPVGQWLKVAFERPIQPANVKAIFSQNGFLGPPPAKISVETEAGALDQDLKFTTTAQPLNVPRGTTRWLRIRIKQVASSAPVPTSGRIAIPELQIGGIQVQRYYRLPAIPRSPAAGSATAGSSAAASPAVGSRANPVVMARSIADAPDCMRGSVRWVCSPTLERRDEEGTGFARIFTEPAADQAKLTGTAVVTGRGVIEKYGRTNPFVSVAASSTWSKSPAGWARSAFDGDPATSWIAAGQDRNPRYTITWPQRTRIDSVTVTRPAMSVAMRVRVQGENGQYREGWLDRTGKLRFAPMQTSKVTLGFTSTQVPRQITDITIPGVPNLGSPGQSPLTLPCGAGPPLTLNGTAIPTTATGTVADLLAGRPFRFQACKAVRIAAGDNRLAAAPKSDFQIQSMVVDPGGRLAAAAERETSSVTVRTWGPGERQVDLDAKARSYLVVNENYNVGWQAKIDGRVLQPLRLDGWRQAWVVPAGTAGTVHLVYEPDPLYRMALLIGLNLLIALVLVAVWPYSRRATGAPPRRAGPTSLYLRSGASVLAVAVGFWVGGYGGLAVTAVVTLLAGWMGGRIGKAARSSWMTAGAMLAGSVALALSIWLQIHGHSGPASDALGDVVPQLFGMVVVGRLAVALAERPDPTSAVEEAPPVSPAEAWEAISAAGRPLGPPAGPPAGPPVGRPAGLPVGTPAGTAAGAPVGTPAGQLRSSNGQWRPDRTAPVRPRRDPGRPRGDGRAAERAARPEDEGTSRHLLPRTW
ncbi:MAG: coagulation factor 5/8 type domain protein [Streptosporangiaceae bacterium]|nr:coagulation factor 5/8 type domain protein [Streptosporangiaceae bacterium]